MSKFESFAPKVENPESEAETSLEKRKSVIEKLTNKFPKLRSLVLAFVTTTAALSAPELAQTNEPVQGTKIEQKASRPEETAEAALEKISDQKFKDVVQKLKDEMALIGVNVPTNSLYSEVSESMSVNNGNTFNENKIGNLPESAQNVFINSEHVSGYSSQDKHNGDNGSANMMDGIKSVFYVSPVEKGSIIEGGKIEIKGFGHTRSEALQNALEDGAKFLEVEIASNTTLDDKMEDRGDKSSFETTLTSTIKSGSKHFVKEYKIINDEQPKGEKYSDGGHRVYGSGFYGDNQEHRVTIEITGGQFTPEK